MKNKIIFALLIIFLVLINPVCAEDSKDETPGIPAEWSEESTGGTTNPPATTTPPQNTITYTTYDNTLQITEVRARVDGKEDVLKKSGEKISKEAKEESDVELKVEIKNVWGEIIDDIKVTAVIEDIDDGDNLDEDTDIGRLNVGASETAELDLELPLRVDDGSYDLKIKARGKDSNNDIHVTEWELTLEVKKDDHKVKITEVSVSPSHIRCGEGTDIKVEVLNLGRNAEDIEIAVINPYLGLELKEKGIELETGDDADAEYEKQFRIMPNDAKEGNYQIDVKAYYNKGKDVTSKKADLTIEGCMQVRQNSVVLKTLPPSPSETLGKIAAQTSGTTFVSAEREQTLFFSLTIIFIVMVGMMVFLMGVIVVKLSRR